MATYRVKSQGQEYSVTVIDSATGGATVTVEDQDFSVEYVGGETSPAPQASAPSAALAIPAPMAPPSSTPAPAAAPAAGQGSVVAPIPGKVVAIDVKVGDTVSANQVVLKLEAMKMENDIVAPISGKVVEIAVSEGSEAAAGQLLMSIG
jgi:glutaconyl-CoA decarboxylase